jgi:hypothetical protein
MAISIQQVSDYGTANSIVARLSLQTSELLQCCRMPQKQKKELFGSMFSHVQPKVMACFSIKERLSKEIRAHQKKIDETGLELQAQGRAYTLPSILDLRLHAETFLYNAKSALRDFTAVFLVLFSKDFGKKAHYHKVHEWAEQHFGSADPLTKMLDHDQATWIARIVKMRNAVEHPDDHSGVLHVENFTVTQRGNTAFVTEPMWYLDSETKGPIAAEMDVFVTNLLTFCEETVVLCLEEFNSGFPIAFAEIPEAERDPACPMRFRVVLNQMKTNAQPMH